MTRSVTGGDIGRAVLWNGGRVPFGGHLNAPLPFRESLPEPPGRESFPSVPVRSVSNSIRGPLKGTDPRNWEASQRRRGVTGAETGNRFRFHAPNLASPPKAAARPRRNAGLRCVPIGQARRYRPGLARRRRGGPRGARRMQSPGRGRHGAGSLFPAGGAAGAVDDAPRRLRWPSDRQALPLAGEAEWLAVTAGYGNRGELGAAGGREGPASRGAGEGHSGAASGGAWRYPFPMGGAA